MAGREALKWTVGVPWVQMQALERASLHGSRRPSMTHPAAGHGPPLGEGHRRSSSGWHWQGPEHIRAAWAPESHWHAFGSAAAIPEVQLHAWVTHPIPAGMLLRLALAAPANGWSCNASHLPHDCWALGNLLCLQSAM